MTTAFSGPSRLINLREKKHHLNDNHLNQQGELKLTLPEQNLKNGYQPSSGGINSKNSMRILKGKIDRNHSNDKQDIKSSPVLQFTLNSQQKLTLTDNNQHIKLVLNDQPILSQKKVSQEPSVKPHQKRIMILKQSSKQQQIVTNQATTITKLGQSAKIKKGESVKEENKKVGSVKEESKGEKYEANRNIHNNGQIIKQQEIEQSQQPQIESENDLVLCPEGCGRKFNRKALQKHAKACKIVFMSKRKQFNSEAKRLTSKQQANLVKQNKLKQKNQLIKSKNKAVQKAGDNWKAASQDFRAAIKAIKKDEEVQEEEEGTEENIDQGEEIENKGSLNLVSCKYCEKMFAEVFIQKHIENCARNKDKEKKKIKKK